MTPKFGCVNITKFNRYSNISGLCFVGRNIAMAKYILTKKQKEVYDYIRAYMEKNSISPYIREIQKGCSIQCYKSAVDKLLALEKKGYIKRLLNKHRSITLNGFEGEKREDIDIRS